MNNSSGANSVPSLVIEGPMPLSSALHSPIVEALVGLPDSLQAHNRTNESLRINACFEGARSAQWLAPKLLCRKKSGAARIILASTLQASLFLAGCAGKSPALSAPFSTGDCRQHHSKEQALRVLQEKKGGVS